MPFPYEFPVKFKVSPAETIKLESILNQDMKGLFSSVSIDVVLACAIKKSIELSGEL